MTEPRDPACSLMDVLRARRSTRCFAAVPVAAEVLDDVLRAAVLAPFGSGTGLPLAETRRVFVFSQGTPPMKRAEELIVARVSRKARQMNLMLALLPFLRKKMAPFAGKLNLVKDNGIPAFREAAHYIVVAERKGFPPVARQSIAHALQNMWLAATGRGLGFQLLSATGIMAADNRFLALLGLTKGEFALDGCLIGIPGVPPPPAKDLSLDDFVTWIR